MSSYHGSPKKQRSSCGWSQREVGEGKTSVVGRVRMAVLGEKRFTERPCGAMRGEGIRTPLILTKGGKLVEDQPGLLTGFLLVIL